ncbi:DNA alkylation repair protein [uncultured Microbacterium sp.]|uniref:DNA alkylation repair protein n=1 Tax=uncultured Microbacterium sp. TaxID=191216 RepID=UPI0025DEC682|nr:DNA alkylation repair protein [uncultured Microbacterium sp.]
MIDGLPSEIRAALRAAADPVRASGQRAYMKSEMPFLGVRVPEVRHITGEVVKGVTDPEELRDAALDLWRAAEYREERYAAQAILALPLLRGDLELLPVHEETIRTGAWWDHVDEAAHRLVDLLDAHPAAMSVELRVWAGDEDLWIRRAAIISQLLRRESTDRALLTDVVEANLDDREFFVRKAIGWALRDYARSDPEWVRSFVEAHPTLSPLSRREALRRLG